MIVTSRIVCSVFIAVLLAVLATLLAMLRAPDTRPSELLASLAEMKQIDALWSADVLSLELGLNPNYDSVAAPVGKLAERYRAIETLAAGAPAWGHDLSASLAAYRSAMDDKIRIVERIKAQYSIISNSSRLLPIAAADLFAELEGSRPQSNPPIADLLTRIVIDMASYIVTPSEQLRQAIDTQMTALREAAGRASPEAASKAETLLAHMAVILRQKQLGTRLIVDLTAVPTAQAIDRLQRDAQALEADQNRDRSLLRDLVLACTFLLIAATAWAGYLLRRHYRRLNQDNSALQQANEDAQSQLIQSSKLSAMGQMVAGITHEINTPLAYVKAVFCLIRDQMAEMHPVGTAAPGTVAELRPAAADGQPDDRIGELNMLIDEGLHGLEEITNLIITMKNFSRLDKGRLEYVDIEEALDSAALIARSEVKYIADTVKDYGKIPRIHASPTQLKQVFLNLINNAAHAMADQPKRGKLTLRTRAESEDSIRIEIEDSGTGIPPDVLPRIFDPFFTTKDVGKGTGMGLSICYRIIQTHGGTISARSEVGVGTTFTIILPHRAKADAEHRLEQAAA
ncbi:DAHL domain-containing protein [Inquilinus sp. Marseille-Q2685]|uniref:DAHL domain-containing protein n=1 Tax=Inquilinus sp. Marseille-Q2685 TaxID=2866581 RepID=UPI001CE44359|nr:DAHL domain-containing protein [Inquilinus sp. Marseille-Q2685]